MTSTLNYLSSYSLVRSFFLFSSLFFSSARKLGLSHNLLFSPHKHLKCKWTCWLDASVSFPAFNLLLFIFSLSFCGSLLSTLHTGKVRVIDLTYNTSQCEERRLFSLSRLQVLTYSSLLSLVLLLPLFFSLPLLLLSSHLASLLRILLTTHPVGGRVVLAACLSLSLLFSCHKWIDDTCHLIVSSRRERKKARAKRIFVPHSVSLLLLFLFRLSLSLSLSLSP